MIEGINIRCNVGGVEVLRSPRIVLTLRRRAVVSTCEVDIPDADGHVQASLAKKQAVRVRFGHRGEGGTWHDWSGTVKDFQPAGPDTIRVQAVGLEQALIDTTVTEAMHGEPADVGNQDPGGNVPAYRVQPCNRGAGHQAACRKPGAELRA